MIVYGEDLNEHAKNVRGVTHEMSSKNNITLNPAKFKFAQEGVEFVGFQISNSGISAYPNKFKAITAFPKPENISDLRSFMGLVNQLGDISKYLSTVSTST